MQANAAGIYMTLIFFIVTPGVSMPVYGEFPGLRAAKLHRAKQQTFHNDQGLLPAGHIPVVP